MLTGFVLTNVAVGGLAILTAPLLFRGLLELHYPLGFEGEASSALAGSFAPEPHRSAQGLAPSPTLTCSWPRRIGSASRSKRRSS
jgi:hypothetical protein